MQGRINLQYFFLFVVVSRLILIDLSLFSFAAIIISIYQFALLFLSINHIIPFRHLFGSLMCLQLLIGPMFAYNGLDRFQDGLYKMQVPESEYFSYVLPAVLAFLLGLNLMTKNLAGERLNSESLKSFVRDNPELPYYLIGIGFVSSFLSEFFGSELSFVFVLLGGLKFVGLFLIILGDHGIKPVTLAVVYGSIIVSSLGVGMFHDLITWLIFLAIIYALKYKPNNLIKSLLLLLLVSVVVVIQQLKGDYREATWRRGEQASVETVAKTIESSRQKTDPFSFESFGKSNLRINQGYIITNIMITVPDRVPFENGTELLKILEAAFLPRIIAPDKLQAGDRDIFMKYTGIMLQQGTSMGLSSVGDAYINFGVLGGWVFMFFYGMFFNFALKRLGNLSSTYPIIPLLATIVFYYPIRPDCELQTIMGHLIKSIFLIMVMLFIWKRLFKSKLVTS
jgi:hypothetical protein